MPETLTTPHFKRSIGLLTAAMLAASLIGCGGYIRGGGSRSVQTVNGNTEAVFGIGDRETLSFVIFTDIGSEDTVSSGGSTWSGQIKPPQGKTVVYEGSSDSMDINGTEYRFNQGRVFLVSTKDGGTSVQQLKVPFVDNGYKTELDRIEKLERVQTFLNN